MWVTSNRQDRTFVSGESKAPCWKTFIEEDKEVISGFSALGVSAIPSRETMTLIGKFVCQLLRTKDIYLYGERAELVVVSKEASAVRNA